MILELDAGNTRIKWRRLDHDTGRVIDEGACADREDVISELVDQRPQMVRLCSVRPPEVTDKLRQWAAVVWGLELQLAEVTRSCAGVSNQYKEPRRMGADRWLAMIAAFNRRPGACAVVDAGTALTIDLVAGDGLHLGGYILPGRKLMASSLEDNTLIRLRIRETTVTNPGTDTDAAVLNGILASQIALLDQVMGNMTQQSPEVNLVLTGGDAALLEKHLTQYKGEIVPNLVLDGLTHACPFHPGSGI